MEKTIRAAGVAMRTVGGQQHCCCMDDSFLPCGRWEQQWYCCILDGFLLWELWERWERWEMGEMGNGRDGRDGKWE
ncbi:MAG: hypothetical protein ACI3YI_04165 [Bacteroidaceae bacterium]